MLGWLGRGRGGRDTPVVGGSAVHMAESLLAVISVLFHFLNSGKSVR
jgi:hypothetical protein